MVACAKTAIITVFALLCRQSFQQPNEFTLNANYFDDLTSHTNCTAKLDAENSVIYC